jgi:hypothetical protein
MKYSIPFFWPFSVKNPRQKSRIEENIDILTVFPQLLTENGPKYGKTVKLGSKTIMGWTPLL